MKQITAQEFDQAIAEWVVVVDFFAEWCPPCKALTPVLENYQVIYGDKIKIYKVDVDQEQGLAMQQGITAMPTLQFFKNGTQVNMVRWFDPTAIMAAIDDMLK